MRMPSRPQHLFALSLLALAAHASAADYYMVTPNPIGRRATTAPGQQPTQPPVPSVSLALASFLPTPGAEGTPYQLDLRGLTTLTGGALDAVTYSIAGGSLPAGLTLGSNGQITGTPTGATPAEGQLVTVQASFGGKTAQQSYVFSMQGMSITLATATLPQAQVGQPYGFDFKSLASVTLHSVGVVSWSLVSGTLPAGLTLGADGVLAGTPTAASSGTVTVRASYKSAQGEQSYQLVTLKITATLAAATLPQALVGQAYSYDLKPLLTVTGDGAYNIGAVSWSLVSGALPAGLTLGPNGVISGTPTAAATGPVTVRAAYRNAAGEQSYGLVALQIQVSLAAATLPTAHRWSPYSYDLKQHLQVSGDDAFNPQGVTFEAKSVLPAGLTLSPSGSISGTPTDSGTTPAQVQATYKNKVGQQLYQLQVGESLITLTLANATLPPVKLGVNYSYDFSQLTQIANTPFGSQTKPTYSGTAPAGMTLNSAGVLQGTFSTQGDRTLTVQASYADKTANATYTLKTLAPTLNMSAVSLGQMVVGKNQSNNLATGLVVTGETYVPITWRVKVGTLPAGLTLTTAGVLSGTPTNSGTYSFTVEAEHDGVFAQQAYSGMVANPSIESYAGGRRWTTGKYAGTCQGYKSPTAPAQYLGATGSGIYTIQGADSVVQNVYCDMDTDGGGWTLVLNEGRNSYTEMRFKDGIYLSNALTPTNVVGASGAIGVGRWYNNFPFTKAKFVVVAGDNPAQTATFYKSLTVNNVKAWSTGSTEPEATKTCTDYAMTQNCTTTGFWIKQGMNVLDGVKLSKYGYQTDPLSVHGALEGSNGGFCSVTLNYNNNAWADSFGDGHWGNGLLIWFR